MFVYQLCHCNVSGLWKYACNAYEIVLWPSFGGFEQRALKNKSSKYAKQVNQSHLDIMHSVPVTTNNIIPINITSDCLKI